MPPETLTLRTAGADDMEALVALRFAFLEEFRHIGPDLKARLEPELRGYFTRHLGKPAFVALLGLMDDVPVCTAFLTLNEAPPNDQYPNGLIGYVFNVYTAPEHRKKGHARLLVGRLVQEAKRLGATAINLNASPAGVGLYQQLGFAALTDTAMRMMMP